MNEYREVADMQKNKKNSLSREQAGAIYDDLQRTMTTLMKKHGGKLPPVPSAKPKATAPSRPESARPAVTMAADEVSRALPPDENPNFPLMLPTKRNRGHIAALGLVCTFAAMKVLWSILEASGVAGVETAHATFDRAQAITNSPITTSVSSGPRSAGAEFTREELAVLTALDHRRVELEARARRLDDRERDLEKRDREFLARQTELKELTDKLQADRNKQEKKRSTQIEQLANVYGSMNPPEAATLIEQLDVHIALELLERMPEKRIGQILALMSRERALTITRLLSGKPS